MRKVASAGNRLNPSSNGISALLESCVADQSIHNFLFPQNSHHLRTDLTIITVFVDTRLSKTKYPRKRFQNFWQSCMLSTDQIEIHQSQPLVWPSDLLYVMLASCDWWISIQSVDNMHDWQKFWKRFHRCFVFESRVSTKTVVILLAKGMANFMLHSRKLNGCQQRLLFAHQLTQQKCSLCLQGT